MSFNAASVMTHQVTTVSLDATVADVARTLARNGISGAPVCDRDGKLLGMISEGDLLRPFAVENKLFRSWWLSLLAEGAELLQSFLEYARSDRRCARDLMTCPAITADKGATLAEIVDLLQRHHVKRIPILCNGELVGVVSRADIIAALHRMPDAFGGRMDQHDPIGSRNPRSISLGSIVDRSARSNGQTSINQGATDAS